MPELPEVETIARGLDQRVRGDVVESVWLSSKPQPLKSSAAEMVSVLESARIARVRRVGKHIVFDLESGKSEVRHSGKRQSRRGSPTTRAFAATMIGPQWVVHLGMTGRMLVCTPDLPIEKHTHAIVRLASGREVRFVDPRRFGRLSVSQDFSAAGAEPLKIDAQRFVDLFRGRNTPIKSALLNQKLLTGIGNIYADESLFRAGIRPRRRAASLTREALRRLHGAVQRVLEEAVALGGSSVSDYVDADGEEGFFQLQHRVYGREGEPCLVCKTAVKRVVVAGRSSHYCPKCQK